jgi:hypothetical protein
MATEIQNEPATIAEPTFEEPNPFPVYSVVSGLLIVASLVFAGKGWYTLYDDSYNARIVGGDAYNFIIYATRGTALVCVGIVCAVLSVTFAVFAHLQKKS